MANLCWIDMHIQGKKEDIKKLEKALQEDGKYRIGRGAYGSFEYEEDGAVFMGECKWSLNSALIDSAISMKTHPELWAFSEDVSNITFITLVEAGRLFSLDIEAYTEEEGIGFQEHILIKDGSMEKYEVVDYEYDHETDTATGGFGEWDFEI